MFTGLNIDLSQAVTEVIVLVSLGIVIGLAIAAVIDRIVRDSEGHNR